MSGGLQTSRGGNGQGGITNYTYNTSGAVDTITLTQPSNVITILNQAASGTIAVDFNGGTPVVGVGNGIDIPAGAGFTWDGVALQSFTLIGSAGSLQVGIIAH